jgi:hypothetical protein
MSGGEWLGPRRAVESLAAAHGKAAVVAACVDLLRGREVAGELIAGLGGPPARWAVDGGTPGPDYWQRVWALRGLLWLWDDAAAPAVVRALHDDAWRVREMAAKVVARQAVGAAFGTAEKLRDDDVARVRQAAARAVAALTVADA